MQPDLSGKQKRIESIDLLRGIVMVIMALDHTRDYFHADSFIFSPTDLAQTNGTLFFTRWITHYCAPVFMFLTGTSAFLVGQRKSKKELSVFLFTRGIWLMFLELTVVNFSWFFNIHFPIYPLQVIWALGVSMIALAALIHLPKKVILVVGILIVAGHNLLDNIHVEGVDFKAFLWAELHERKSFVYGGHTIRTGYPVLAWIGVVALGYYFGTLYEKGFPALGRRKTLLTIGYSAIALFILLRIINVYGDPHPWITQSTIGFTILSFLDVHKYPPSLLYLLVTLGPAILFLAWAENSKGSFSRAIITIGRVPLFFYLLHIYLIHLGAMLAAQLTGHKWSDMVLNTPIWSSPHLKGYGFSLPVVYLVWVAVILLLYPLCRWYDTYKSGHKEKWWLSYL